MNNKKSKIATVCIVVAFIILALCVFIWFPFRSTNSLKVSFICSTNDITLGYLAVFNATNESDFDTWFIPCPPQTKAHGVWSELTYNYGVGTDLHAHDSCTFFTAFATNCESWRMPVNWFYKTPNPIEDFRGQVKANAYRNWERLSRGRWPKYYNRASSTMGNSYMAFSPELLE
ncbi:MAG TPA: hypothetical protein VFC17_03080 [Candidatus Limnocylindrales bacterium]|nr:hypothetical protein [Candidatus Limnocylindrales bacterium]